MKRTLESDLLSLPLQSAPFKCRLSQRYASLALLSILLCVSAFAEDKIAKVLIGDGAFEAGPLNLAAWIAYGSARADFLSCDGYTYSYEEELTGRRAMVAFWKKQSGGGLGTGSQYLEDLAKIEDAKMLEEYVWLNYFNDGVSIRPNDLELAAYHIWAKDNLSEHVPETNADVVLEEDACRRQGK